MPQDIFPSWQRSVRHFGPVVSVEKSAGESWKSSFQIFSITILVSSVLRRQVRWLIMCFHWYGVALMMRTFRRPWGIM